MRDRGLTDRPERLELERARGYAGGPTSPVVPNGVLAMVIFLATEVMLFAGLISAFLVARSSVPNWPPMGQPRLPLEVTALNTAALVASGVLLLRADQAFADFPLVTRTGRLLATAMALGALFVGVQGYEWVRLIGFGLTLTSSPYGSYFYLIVGVHALHAVAALVGLGYVRRRLWRGALTRGAFRTAQIFWYFVVGVWPVLYLLVYLW